MKRRYERIKPVTENEKNLAHVLQLVTEVVRLRRDFNRQLKGSIVDNELNSKYQNEIWEFRKKDRMITGNNKPIPGTAMSITTYSSDEKDRKEEIAAQIKN